MAPSLILTMDKWTHLLEPPLGVQLLTPVTLATHCLVHRHVLVEQMDCGHLLNHSVKASTCVTNLICCTLSVYPQLLTVVLSLILTMDKLTHHLEPSLGAQLPTPVTLATHCLVHRHVLVEQMDCGHLLSQSVKASTCVTNPICCTMSVYPQLLTVVPSLILLMYK